MDVTLDPSLRTKATKRVNLKKGLNIEKNRAPRKTEDSLKELDFIADCILASTRRELLILDAGDGSIRHRLDPQKLVGGEILISSS